MTPGSTFVVEKDAAGKRQTRRKDAAPASEPEGEIATGEVVDDNGKPLAGASYQFLDNLDSPTEAALRKSIVQDGIRYPIVRDQFGNVLDGHQRLRIGTELELEVPEVVYKVRDDVHARQLAWTLNMDRRHLTPAQRDELARAMYDTGASQRKIAEDLGTSQATVNRAVSSPGDSDESPARPRASKSTSRNGRPDQTREHKPAKPKPAKSAPAADGTRTKTERRAELEQLAQNRGVSLTHMMCEAVDTLLDAAKSKPATKPAQPTGPERVAAKIADLEAATLAIGAEDLEAIVPQLCGLDLSFLKAPFAAARKVLARITAAEKAVKS